MRYPEWIMSSEDESSEESDPGADEAPSVEEKPEVETDSDKGEDPEPKPEPPKEAKSIKPDDVAHICSRGCGFETRHLKGQAEFGEDDKKKEHALCPTCHTETLVPRG